jgi:hypothetical protein
MKVTQNILISTALTLFCIPALSAQNFSKYREFSLGSSLAVVSKQVDLTPDEIKTVHQAPVLMQDVTYWPGESSTVPTDTDPVQEMELSFCSGKLYSISVFYKSSATEGFSDEDMIKAVSATYGVAIRPAAEKTPAQPVSFSSGDVRLATWEDAQGAVTLSRSGLSQSFRLVVLSKQLQADADAASAQDIAQETADAPALASAREKQEAQDQQTERDANLKAFRP